MSDNYELNFQRMQRAPQTQADLDAGTFEYSPPADLSRLSRGERWVYDALPGFSNAPISKAMQWFSEGWRGKLLNAFDIGAEGLERGIGLYAQWRDAKMNGTLDEFKSDLGAAWRAGSLYYDMSNIPKFTDDGLQWETEGLPGMAGVVRARRMIAQGMELEEVRGKIYDSLGVMALRAQLNDAMGHVVLDPINALMPMIKPVERTQKALMSIAKLAHPEHILNATQEFGRMEKIVNSVDDLADIGRIAENAEDLTRLGSNVDEARKLGRIIEELGEGATKEDVLKRLGGLVEQYNSYKQMTPVQQKILQLTGNLPGMEKAFDDLPKWQQVLRRLNPLALTPQARADGILNIVTDNLGILSTHADDPVEMATIIRRVADGTMGREFGHMVVRPEGRLVQSALQSIAGKADDMADAWTMAEKFERPLLKLMEDVLGETGASIVRQFDNKEAPALYQRFMQAVGKSEDAQKELARVLVLGERAELTVKDFASTLDMFAKTPALLHESGMKVTLYADALELIAKQGIITFGVKQQGVLSDWSNALKRVETIAFLRLNPTYPIRNLINNTTTMLARGIFNNDAITKALTRGSLDKFWSDMVGFVPPRAAEGIGMHAVDVAEESLTAAGKTGEALSEGLGAGRRVLSQQVRGKPGLLSKTAEWIEKNTVGRLKADFGTLAQNAERWASERGFASGFLRWRAENWRVGGKHGFTAIRQDLGRRIGKAVGIEDAADVLHNYISGTLNPKKLDHIKDIENLRLDIGNIVAEAEKIFPEIRQVLPDGMIQKLGDDLAEVAGKGDDAVRGVMNQFRNELQDAITKQMDDTLELMAEEAAAVVKTEGPGAYTKIMSEVVDDTRASRGTHAIETARIMEEIRNGADPATVAARYSMYRQRQSAFWGRHWQRQEARMGALGKVAKEVGVEGSEEVLRNFKQVKKSWEKFFTRRDKLWSGFFEKGDEFRSFESIVDELDNLYKATLDAEDLAMRNIDDLMSKMLEPDMREGFFNWRNRIANARRADGDAVAEFRKSIRGLTKSEVNEAWRLHWQERLKRQSAIKQMEDEALAWMRRETEKKSVLGILNIQKTRKTREVGEAARDLSRGSFFDTLKKTKPDAAAKLENAAAEVLSPRDEIMRLANEYGINVAYQKGNQAVFFDDELMAIVNKYLRGGYDKEGVTILNKQFDTLDDLFAYKSDAHIMVERALAARESFNNTTDVMIEGSKIPHIQNYYEVAGMEMNMGAGMDELLYQRGNLAVDALEDALGKAMKDPAVRFSDLDPADALEFDRYIKLVQGEMNDARYAALRMGEYVRDSALLNYSRRYNYNTWLGVLAPYEFWATQTAFRWALHSIDRPAMMSTYLRMSKMIRTGYRPETGFPSRLKGSIRMKMPFISDWFGDWIGDDVFTNPLMVALPFDNLGRPLDEMQYQTMSDQGATQRVLEELYNDGQITEQEFNEASQSQSGAVWERAAGLVKLDDSERRSNAFDFMSMVVSPHAPLTNAYHRLMGEPEEIGPWMPATRTIKAVTGMFGINEGKGLNIEGAIRKEMGLHPFDQWEDYRIERMMVNMLAEGGDIGGMPITSEMVQRALIEQSGPLWSAASKRVGVEWGLAQTMGSFTGVPTQFYPEGEEQVRRERELYEQAWEMYEDGDHQAINRFMEEYPEYEARLSLFKSPEERLNTFLVDQIWDTYNQLPDLDKREVREQLGDTFVNAFLNPDTRSTGSLPPEQLGMWLKMMGGEPTGTLGNNAVPIAFAPPEISQTAQFFYDYRRQNFPNFYQQQQEYFNLDESQRREYKRQNPKFAEYMEWRWDFLLRNPSVAPYLTDNPPTYDTYKDMQMAHALEPNISYDEFESVMFDTNPALLTDIQMYAYNGVLSDNLKVVLDNLSQNMGVPSELYLNLIRKEYQMANAQ